MAHIQQGMFVRCPIDKEFPDQPRRFALGKVVSVSEMFHQVDVSFYGQEHLLEAYEVPKTGRYAFEDILRCEIQPLTDVTVKSMRATGRIVCTARDQARTGSYCAYYVLLNENGKTTMRLVDESDILAPFYSQNPSPVEQMQHYEFHNPTWYAHRQVVIHSIQALKNASFGFETLVGSRVFLLPHQVDTIVRGISESTCRFMLADEVGLGKTVQAAVIKKGLEQRLGELRVLFVVPESLAYQWKNEMSYKFWEDIPVWSPGSRLSYERQVIFPLEQVATPEGQSILEQKWDLCIVDETHRLLQMPGAYDAILDLSRRTEHVLILSATPIQSRRTEYLKLLAILEPKRYGTMSEGEFSEILEKQAYLNGKIHSLVRDLDDYQREELAEDYLDDLEDICERLQDPLLERLVQNIDIDAEDEGLSSVRLALAYIAEHYQIERKIIRHRRAELESRMQPRSLTTIPYFMTGADQSFYEVDTYEMLLEYLEYVGQKATDLNIAGEYIRLLLSAMFSSPWALVTVLEQRDAVLKNKRKKSHIEKHLCVVEQLKACPNEPSYLEQVMDLAKRWKRASAAEFTRLEELYDEPDLINGRLMRVVDYVSQSVDEKFVIFTNWKETLLPLRDVLVQKFGKEAVTCFYKGLDDKELQYAVDTFQRESKCRFMVCDELGGEGRNFQMADEVIHIDLPWSPSDLEQRIGRLDRIGREKEVVSVVLYAEETLETSLFNIWNDGLNIFQESLSGLEIALGEIKENVQNALLRNLRYGMGHLLSEMQGFLQVMRQQVERERYFDMARQLDPRVQEQLTALIERFDGEDGKKLAQTMMSWSSMAGFHGTIGEQGRAVIFQKENTGFRSMKNTLFIPPSMEEAHRRAKRKGQVRGTFARDYAVQREDLIFYAPGDPFFDAIVMNARNSELGRSCAFIKKGAGVDWLGFVLTWSISVDPVPLLQKGQSLEQLVLAQGHVPLEPITHFVSYRGEQVPEELLKAELFHLHPKRLTHLGKRSNKQVKVFQEKFPQGDWNLRVQEAYEESLSRLNEQIPRYVSLEQAESMLQRRIDGLKAANLYYGKANVEESYQLQQMQTVKEALLKGLQHPHLNLESMAFVWMVKD